MVRVSFRPCVATCYEACLDTFDLTCDLTCLTQWFILTLYEDTRKECAAVGGRFDLELGLFSRENL